VTRAAPSFKVLAPVRHPEPAMRGKATKPEPYSLVHVVLGPCALIIVRVLEIGMPSSPPCLPTKTNLSPNVWQGG
jgi:hypothetical protein